MKGRHLQKTKCTNHILFIFGYDNVTEKGKEEPMRTMKARRLLTRVFHPSIHSCCSQILFSQTTLTGSTMIPPSERQTTAASAACYVVAAALALSLRDSCPNGTMSHKDIAGLQCDPRCRLPRSSGVQRVLCRSGRGWRPSSVCVRSIISRTVLRSWLKQ